MSTEQTPAVAMSIEERLTSHRGTMSITQTSMVFGRSKDCVRDWILLCGFPATKIHGTYWIDPVLAARWWREQSTTVANPTKPPAMRRTRPMKATSVVRDHRMSDVADRTAPVAG